MIAASLRSRPPVVRIVALLVALLVLAAGVAFNLAHAIGNLVLALVAGPELRRVLDRHGRSVHTEVVWA